MRFGIIAAGVVAGLVALPAQILAGPAPAWRNCTGEPGPDWDKQIEACSALIALPRQSVEKRARAFNNRGLGYRAKADGERAISDLSEAIKLTPKNADTYYNRGLAYAAGGDNERAMANYNMAIGINPKQGDYYYGRGRISIYLGATDTARADLDSAMKYAPDHRYAALWLDSLRRRNNLPTLLPRQLGRLDMKTWPAPVIRLFLNETTPAAMFAAVDDPDPTLKKGNLCEANFYSGELAVLRGDTAEAKRLFQLAANDCVWDYIEWEGAKARLKMLGN